MSDPDMLNYFDSPNKSISGNDDVFVVGGTSRIGGYELSADRFGKILRNAAENTVFVKQPSDFENIDSTKNYMVDGAIDMAGTSIVIPETGISISGLNGARDTSILYSSEDNYTMFVTPDGGYSGGIVMDSMTINVTGVNSKIFDLDNDGLQSAIDITGVNFGLSPSLRTTSLGSLTDYRQLLMNNVGFIFVDDGLTFNGVWTGLAVTTSIVVGFSSGTLFKEGVGFAIGNIRSDINFLSVETDSVLFDFDEENVTTKGGFALNNVRTTADNAVPNFSNQSSYARFRNCDGIENTYVGGQWSIISQDTTNISAPNTPVKMSGTTAYKDLGWFTQSENNAFIYDGDQEIHIEAEGTFSISGTNNKVIKVHVLQWDDGAGSYVTLSKTGGATLNAGGRGEDIPIRGYGVLQNNDRIEVWIENTTDDTDVTSLLDGLFSISERAS